MIIENKKLGKFELKIDNITQGDLEKYYRLLKEDFPSFRDVTVVEYNGNTVRILSKLGWLEPKISVDVAKPSVIRFIAGKFNEELANILEIPKN